MDGETLSAVNEYISNNIFHSSTWDSLQSADQLKAVGNYIDVLTTRLKDYFPDEQSIPVNVLANQTVWFVRIDDTFLRAEMGVTYIQMSGVMVNIKDKDRSISPYVLDYLGITPDALTGGLSRRKVGQYRHRRIGTPDSIYSRLYSNERYCFNI